MENGTVRPNKKSFQWSKLFVQNPQYFDYDLLMILVFLMCFGLVMLYSSSSYTSANKYGDSAHYLKLQARNIAIGLVFMFYFAKK